MTRPDLQFRQHRSSDLDAMFRLDQICFEPEFRFSHTVLKRYAEAKNARVTIAEMQDRLAGFCILHIQILRNQKTAYIVTLDVEPSCRRKGVATGLLQEAALNAVAAGCASLTLHVYMKNTNAIEFYEREGFQRIGDEESFYGPGIDAVVYHKPLV